LLIIKYIGIPSGELSQRAKAAREFGGHEDAE
jgi:hypothetical protein